ncbi:MAG: putative methyltransferase [Ilumatobacteraceae bacterium]|nr:putative methyltransferase [Ilumatobacteraceae bacterium]
MQGYDSASYGDAFADVYDEWYGDVSDVDATVECLARLAAATPHLPVVELGVGTGRLALPLARRIAPTPVIGLDSSRAMLERLASNRAADGAPDAVPIDARVGDMVDDVPVGPLGVVFVAFNTFFNLGTRERQEACFHAVHDRLADDGCFVIEAAVPDAAATTGGHVDVRSMTADRVVLSVARYDSGSGVAEGQFIELTELGGVRLRPWSVRYVGPDELDAMAAEAGFRLRDRWETFAGEAYHADSGRHVSVYASH